MRRQFLEDPSDGCQDDVSEWRNRGDVKRKIGGLCSTQLRDPHVQVEEIFI